MTDTGSGTMPDFISVGPPRTATTWLQRVLGGHVTLPIGIKETDFFGANYDLGVEWYRAHFVRGSPSLPAGEICPTYFDSPIARGRIARHIPRCRIICTLRDPLERIYSHYRLLRHEGLTNDTLEHTLERHRRGDWPGNLLNSSRYATHLVEWRRVFGSASVLVLIHHDLEADPQAFIGQVCEFLSISPITLEKSGERNLRVNLIEHAPLSSGLARSARRIKMRLIRHRRYRALAKLQPIWDFCASGGPPFPPICHETEVALRAELNPEIEALEALIERDLSAWKRGRQPDK